MKTRYKHLVVNWPWCLRWTLGAVILLGVIVPGAVFWELGVAIRDAALSYHRSEAWRFIAAAFTAIVIGDRDHAMRKGKV